LPDEHSEREAEKLPKRLSSGIRERDSEKDEWKYRDGKSLGGVSKALILE